MMARWRILVGGLAMLAAVWLGGDAIRPRPAGGQTTGDPARVAVGYALDGTAGTYRQAVAASDPADLADTSMAAIPLPTGRPTLRISARFAVAGGSATLTCVRAPAGTWSATNLPQVDEITVTASMTRTIGGLYVAPDAVFDTGGMGQARVRVYSLAGGPVTLVRSTH